MIINGYKSKDFDLIFDWIHRDKERYRNLYDEATFTGEEDTARDYWQRILSLEGIERRMQTYCRNTPNEPDRNIGS